MDWVWSGLVLSLSQIDCGPPLINATRKSFPGHESTCWPDNAPMGSRVICKINFTSESFAGLLWAGLLLFPLRCSLHCSLHCSLLSLLLCLLLLTPLSYSSPRCPALLSCCPCTALVLHMSRTLAAIEDDDDDGPDVAQTPSPSTLWPFGTAATTMKPINCSKKAASSAAAAPSHCRKSPALCASFD